MKVKFANKVYEVIYSKEVAGKTIYAVEDEPNHVDWLVNVEVIDTDEESDDEIKKKIINYFKCQSREEPLRKDIHNKWIAWLEKQGKETISQSYLAPKSASQAIKEIITDNANKIEPKFKVGDWIVNKFHDICLITDIDLENSYYICKSNRFDNTEGDIDLTDKEFHLWTLQDAKDGDVLIYDDGWICIFKCIHGVWYSSYCFITVDGEFNLGYEEHSVDSIINGNVKPATKEQRDLLFTKIREAGYEWDVDKKELKKIEQKPVEETSCDKCKNVQPSHSCQDIAELGRCYLEHEKQGEQKPTWSEDDEKKRTLLIKILEVNHPHGLFKVNSSETMRTEELVSWLKSLNYKI